MLNLRHNSLVVRWMVQALSTHAVEPNAKLAVEHGCLAFVDASTHPNRGTTMAQFAPKLAPLHAMLAAVDGVDAKLATRKIVVHFRGRKFAVWCADGEALKGDFDAEAVILCAGSCRRLTS